MSEDLILALALRQCMQNAVPYQMHYIFFVSKSQQNNMEISVGDEFDSSECLKLKVEEIECISNCTYVTESSNTVENGGIKTDVCVQETRPP